MRTWCFCMCITEETSIYIWWYNLHRTTLNEQTKRNKKTQANSINKFNASLFWEEFLHLSSQSSCQWCRAFPDEHTPAGHHTGRICPCGRQKQFSVTKPCGCRQKQFIATKPCGCTQKQFSPVAVPVVCRQKQFSAILFTLVLKVKAENLPFLLCIIIICHYFFFTSVHH